jgi:hypothetical protein
MLKQATTMKQQTAGVAGTVQQGGVLYPARVKTPLLSARALLTYVNPARDVLARIAAPEKPDIDLNVSVIVSALASCVSVCAPQNVSASCVSALASATMF